MWLKDIEEFQFTVEEAMNIILGRNGCGKTRLLSILFPVCPDKEDFRDGGFYRNYCSKDGVDFLFQVRKNGTKLKCSIKRVEEDTWIVKDVNPKVYNAHVHEITGLTKEIVSVLNGLEIENVLTTMTTGVRRKWFEKLSTSDLSYALSAFKKLKDHTRDLTGGIKITQAKIAELKPYVVECSAERETLATLIHQQRVDIEALGKAIHLIQADSTITEERFMSRLDAIGRVSQRINTATRTPLEPRLVLDDKLIDLTNKSASSRAQLDNANRTLGELVDKKAAYEFYSKNAQGLIDNIEKEKTLIERIKNDSWAFSPLKELTTTAMAINGATRMIKEYSTSFTVALDSVKTTKSLGTLQQEILASKAECDEIERKLRLVELALSNNRTHLEHYDHTEDVECPKCATNFKPGVQVGNRETVVADILKQEGIKERGDKALAKVKLELSALESDWANLTKIKEILTVFAGNDLLRILQRKLVADEVVEKHRCRIGGLLNRFVVELERTGDLVNAEDKLAASEKTLATTNLKAGVDLQQLNEDITRQESLVAMHSQFISLNAEAIKLVNVDIEQSKRFEAMEREYNELNLELSRISDHYLLTKFKNQLTDKRQELFDLYSVAAARYKEMSSNYDRLQELETEVAALQKRQETASMMSRMMSPEKGLLRKYFYMSINRITDMMTRYISQVWEYDLIVHPCNIDDSELDYKFPFTAGDNKEPTFDVKRGSEAQRDIFDLVFRLTVYRALGLENFPLILDEPGSSFDEGHRTRLVNFIRGLVSGGYFSQAFIVSHNSDVHSRLSGADFVVISDDGITPPLKYNKNVKIKLRG